MKEKFSSEWQKVKNNDATWDSFFDKADSWVLDKIGSPDDLNISFEFINKYKDPIFWDAKFLILSVRLIKINLAILTGPKFPIRKYMAFLARSDKAEPTHN